MDFIVIPAHNEESTIGTIIKEVSAYSKNIIVVDDGSYDNTYQEALNAGAIVLPHKINLGKGAALRTGCDYATIHGATKIVAMDADGQHEPKEINSFLSALDKHDIVFSYRKRSKSMPAVLRFGNDLINKFLQILHKVNLQDSQCGYRGFTSAAYKKIRWQASDYYMETEMILHTGKHKLKSCEVEIETIYNSNYKGTTVIDGMKIILKICGGKFI